MGDVQNTKPQISNATVKKPSFVKEIVSYAVHEEIEPRSRELMRNVITGGFNMLNDAITKAVDKAFYPEGNGPKRTVKSNGPTDYHPKVNYSTSVYSTDSKPRKESVNQRSSIDVNYIWVDTEQDAKDIIGTLIEEIDNYGKTKVATLYEMVKDENGNKIQTNFTDFTFGWTKNEVNSIGYYRDRGKYFLDLPKPVDITNV